MLRRERELIYAFDIASQRINSFLPTDVSKINVSCLYPIDFFSLCTACQYTKFAYSQSARHDKFPYLEHVRLSKIAGRAYLSSHIRTLQRMRAQKQVGTQQADPREAQRRKLVASLDRSLILKEFDRMEHDLNQDDSRSHRKNGVNKDEEISLEDIVPSKVALLSHHAKPAKALKVEKVVIRQKLGKWKSPFEIQTEPSRTRSRSSHKRSLLLSQSAPQLLSKPSSTNLQSQ